MIRAYIDTTHSKIDFSSATLEEKQTAQNILENKFCAKDSSMKFNYAAKKGWISDIKCFYNKDYNILPTGLIPFLAMYLEKEEIELEQMDMRKFPPIDKQFLKDVVSGKLKFGVNKISPRKEQIEATVSIVKHKSLGMLNCSMGFGKTFVAFLLTQIYSKSKILFLFDGIALVHQTYEKFIEYGMPKSDLSIIQGQNYLDDGRVILLSIDSYEKAFHLLPYVKVVICDEAHQTGRNETSEKIIFACQNAPIKIGLSATPDVLDNPYEQMRLYANLGPVIYEQTIAQSIDNKTSVETFIEIYKTPSDGIGIKGNYADIYEYIPVSEKEAEKLKGDNVEIHYIKNKPHYKAFVEDGDESTHYTNNEERNKLIAEIAKKHNRVVILFSKLKHGENLAKLLPEAVLIHGKDNIAERNKAKQYLEDTEKSIVLSSSIWDQGVDVPAIETLINVAAGVSTVKTMQKLGRAVRQSHKTEKLFSKVIDFDDSKLSPLGAKQFRKRLHTYEEVLKLPIKYL